MSNLLDIGDRLNQWIASTGLKKYEIAEKAGITVVQLSRILSGKSAMSFKLHNAFRSIGADVDWILTGRKPISGAKGKMIARYFLPNIKAVVIDTEEVQDGINIFIYEEVPPAVDLPDEDEVEKVENVIVVWSFSF